ncbi:MAG: hypothetical protein MUE71_08770 [Chitinophagaceae bacterium]|nr:hypothetical protein [Chitinophagaceae bacterium]
MKAGNEGRIVEDLEVKGCRTNAGTPLKDCARAWRRSTAAGRNCRRIRAKMLIAPENQSDFAIHIYAH